MKSTLTPFLVGLLAALGSAGANAVPAFEQPLPKSAIDACVGAIDDRADFAGASRVRHVVDGHKRRALGHKLYIDTSVFDDRTGAVLRQYETTCIVTRGDTPYRIRFGEVAESGS